MNYIAKCSPSHRLTLINTKLPPPSQTTLSPSCTKKPIDVTSSPITTWNWILACSEIPVTSVMSLIASAVRRCAINLTPLSGNARQDVEIFVAGISQIKLQAHYMDFCLKRPNKRDFDTTIYTGCPRRNVPDFGRVFLMLKYTDITQNTYIQSWTVTEIMTREKWGLLAVPNTATCTVDVSRESVDDLGVECSVNRACVTFSCLHGRWKRHVKCLEP